MDELLTSNLTPTEAALAGGLIGSMLITLLIGILIFYILYIIANWKIFTKAGEPGWKSLIPIYNVYIMYKIVNMKSWFWYQIFISICAGIMMTFDGFNPYTMTETEITNFNYAAHPMTLIALAMDCVVTLTAAIIYAHRTAKVFGHGTGFAIGLFFLPNIFWLILAFGSSKYDKKRLKKSTSHSTKTKK